MDSRNGGDDGSSWRTMIVRVWSEPNADHGFRARLTMEELPNIEPSVVFATEPEQVLDAVRDWLSHPAETATTSPEHARD
ncbi:hypothetical protein [Lacisediminihabitans sp.]|uniref:hypothetical protein n=1 Tax=Lacisediminihabitans sp. TaxID=2787631 RepID=UPI00374D1432